MAEMTNKRNSSRGFFIVLGSILAALLIGEAILALVEPRARRLDHRGFYVHDPLLGWKMKPLTQRVNETDEFRAIEVTNSQGIRGGEYATQKKPNEYRVLVLGDSFAEGCTVDFDHLFSEVLKRKLNSQANGTHYEVINCGTLAYGTDQELLQYRTLGRTFNPDLVVLMFYENDPSDNVSTYDIHGKVKRLFTMEGGKLVLSPPPDPATVAQVEHAAHVNLTAHQWLKKKSRVYRLVHASLMELGVLAREEPPRQSLPYCLRLLSSEPTSETSYAWNITEMILVQLNKEVEASGATLVAFSIPSPYTVDGDLWDATKKRFHMNGDRWDPMQVDVDFHRLCDKHAILCMGGVREFQQGAESLGRKALSFYYLRDGHWNGEGHKFVGETIAKSLLDWSKREGRPLRAGMTRSSENDRQLDGARSHPAQQ